MNKNINNRNENNSVQISKINVFTYGILSFLSIVISSISLLFIYLLAKNIRFFEVWQVLLFLGGYILYLLIFSLVTAGTKFMPKWMKLGQIFKRLFDVLCATYLFIFLLPLIFIISILIKFSYRGSIFIRQKRIGQNGKEIHLVKFRTKSVAYKENSDLTKIGKFLNRTSLDYLLRFYNVIEGELSLVGPYARSQEKINKLPEIIKQKLLSVKPGMTGEWQISDTEPDQAINFDIEYIDNWSLLLDLKIIFKTAINVLFDK